VTYWPKKDSSQWLVYTIAGFNVTDYQGRQNAKKVATFNYYTRKFNVTWAPNSLSPQLAPSWVSPKDPFYKWVNKRTYDMVKPMLSLAGITTGLGLIVCACAYIDFRITKRNQATKKDESPRSRQELPLMYTP
jgi:hypothetical protein